MARVFQARNKIRVQVARRTAIGAALRFSFLTAFAVPRDAWSDSLDTNHYTLDLFQGPVLAPIEVTGIAGAYAGYAEGIEGMVANAASPAVRAPYSLNWIEPDLSGSISIPVSWFENNDFDNSGTRDYDYSDFIYGTLGAMLKVGSFGVGTNAELSRYTLKHAAGDSTDVTIGRYHALVAESFADGVVTIGAGARFATLGISETDAELTMFGVAPEVGFLIRPDFGIFRLGATYRSPVEAQGFAEHGATASNKLESLGGLVLPDRVVLPWEVEVGLTLQVGPRPLNPSFIDPRKQREDVQALGLQERDLKAARRARFVNWPRDHVKLALALVVTGSVERGIGLERFLGQNEAIFRDQLHNIGSSGAEVNFSPRAGLEAEPLRDLSHLRFGTYYEPNRFGGVGRQHFTFGADVRVLETTLWGFFPATTYKLQASVDVAPRYESTSFGIGIWH